MRIKIWIDSDKRFTKDDIIFFVDDFPARVQGGDLIDMSAFFNEEGFSDEQCRQVYSLSYSVDFVVWEKDEKGIYLKAYCTGE